MGLACGALCSRERDKNDQQVGELAEFVFYKHLEETRSQGSCRRTASLLAVNEFDNIVNSASNFWINKKQYNVAGNNRPMFQYSVCNKNQLMKIDQSVFTIQEKKAAIKIQRWWKRRKVKQRKVKRYSKSYMNVFYR